MIYWIFKFIMQIALRVFYKNVHFSNVENIPPSGTPVIFACNHPNSFLDAISLGAIAPRGINYFARSDAFNTPFKKWLLGLYHLNPIYRLEEGKENLMKNDQVFERGFYLLHKKKQAVLIHSEGVCVVEKRLRRIKKGTARMAFHAEEKSGFTMNLAIVPIGFNYTYPTQYRKELMIHVGKPFYLHEFKDSYLDNPARAINEFDEKLAKELEKQVIIIDRKEDEEVVEQLFEIYRNDNPDKLFPWKKKSDRRFLMEKNISNKINHLKHFPEKINSIKSSCSEYFSMLKKFDISDREVWKRKRNSFVDFAILFFGFPVFAIGYVLNILPPYLGMKITRKTVRGDVFYASVMLGASFFITLIYYLLMIGVSSFIIGWWCFAVPGFFIITGYSAVLYIGFFRKVRKMMNLTKALNKNPDLLKNLTEMRSGIIKQFTEAPVEILTPGS